MGNRNGLQIGKKTFCSYLNDDGVERTGFFELVEITDNSVTLKTNSGSLLFLPIQRLLKIKQEVSNG